MKVVLRLLIFTLLFTQISFASGLQFSIMIPVGASFSFYNVYFNKDASQTYKDSYRKSRGIIGFDTGVDIQVGYLVSDGNKGMSLLVDIGYSHDSFGLTSSYNDDSSTKIKTKEYYTFENFKLGILPKFHYNNFAIGIGIGIKVPLYLTHSLELFENDISTRTYSYYKSNKIDDIIKNSVITYIKLTFDYSFYVNNKFSILFGVYIGTDFGIDLRGAEKILVESRKLSSFDIGIQLGFKIG